MEVKIRRALGALAVLMLAAACDSAPRPAVQPHLLDHPADLQYEITGTGVTEAQVSYNSTVGVMPGEANANKELHTLERVALPWRIPARVRALIKAQPNFSLKARMLQPVTAQEEAAQDAASLTCRVLQGGKVLAERSVKGFGAEPDCSWGQSEEDYPEVVFEVTGNFPSANITAISIDRAGYTRHDAPLPWRQTGRAVIDPSTKKPSFTLDVAPSVGLSSHIGGLTCRVTINNKVVSEATTVVLGPTDKASCSTV
jgi:hypothetical protein